jgi:hypothetical protein
MAKFFLFSIHLVVAAMCLTLVSGPAVNDTARQLAARQEQRLERVYSATSPMGSTQKSSLEGMTKALKF